uniref:Metallophos domain-containing protein n=1 Tax=Angiostrongylus cantonensis TaxID=6313 RepID=A0A158P879_ANGCA
MPGKGNQNGRSLAKLQRMAQDGDIDLVLHVGDIAYNLDTDDGNVGDEFLRQIEPIAAYVPYMTAVGNHESASNFSHYINRFTMPDSEHNLFYSFDLGSAHFVFFSTEFYFYTEYGWKQIQNQWNWLIDDLMPFLIKDAKMSSYLKKANKNRATVPWILTFGHRPMYCSDFDGDDCTKYESIVYNGTVSPYFNPLAPVHIVSGSAKASQSNVYPIIVLSSEAL